MSLTKQEKKQIRKEHKQNKKSYNADLKALQQKYTPEKFNRSINKRAKQIWMPYIKWDHDWDWTFITDMLQYKIELVKLYIKYFGNTIDEDRNKQIAEMEEAIRLYKVFQDTNFLEEEQAFTKEHTCNYIYFSEKFNAFKEKKYKYVLSTEKDNLIFYDLGCEVFRNKAEQYAMKAGIPIEVLYDQNLTKAFGAEWDSEENHKKAKELFKQAEKNEQEALDKFFLYVSKHIRNWWD